MFLAEHVVYFFKSKIATLGRDLVKVTVNVRN